MARILVSGLINIETTLRVDQFPIPYFPVTYPFHLINTTVAGVGFNISKALATLGQEVQFLSITGSDIYHPIICDEIKKIGISTAAILPAVEKTAQSIILYDHQGKRQIYTDLKDIQEQNFPAEIFIEQAVGIEACILCNINFSRALIPLAKARKIPIACDVHAIHDLKDAFNQDFMRSADILFCSHENLAVEPVQLVEQIWSRFQTPICVIGMGAQGALLATYQDQVIEHFPAVITRPVINTIGAGDALFSSFLDGYLRQLSPQKALQRAILFASYKIGTRGAAEGFLSHPELEQLVSAHYPS